MDDFFLIAKVISAGKNGFVKILFEPGFSGNLEKIENLFIDFWDQKKKLAIEEVLISKSSVFIKFVNFDDDRDISVLIGRAVFISHMDFGLINPENVLPEQMSVLDVYCNGRFIGKVNDFFQTPANPVIELAKQNGKKILIPFVESVFEKIDIKGGCLIIKSDYGFDDED